MAEASVFKTVSGLGALHHIGLAANDRAAVVSLYRDLLGYELSHVDDVPSQQLEALVFGKGAERIEVLIPRSADSAVGRFLAKRGPGMHHLCYAVADLDAVITKLVESGVQLTDTQPVQGLFGPVVFIHPQAAHGVMIELLQPD
ncbi:MAG: VOC family protein [Caldilineaceae bacterium]|nr:VOC family protein [Caldilineaceae bacterium]